MQSIPKFLFGYGPTSEFVSAYPIAESIERLEAAMQHSSDDFFKSRMSGYVRDGRVQLHRERSFTNLYLSTPVFFGRVTTTGGKVVVRGVFTLRRVAKVILSVGLSLLVFIELLLIPATISSNVVSVLKVMTLLFMPAVAGLILIGHFALKRLFRGDIEWLEERIRKALRST